MHQVILIVKLLPCIRNYYRSMLLFLVALLHFKDTQDINLIYSQIQIQFRKFKAKVSSTYNGIRISLLY